MIRITTDRPIGKQRSVGYEWHYFQDASAASWRLAASRSALDHDRIAIGLVWIECLCERWCRRQPFRFALREDTVGYGSHRDASWTNTQHVGTSCSRKRAPRRRLRRARADVSSRRIVLADAHDSVGSQTHRGETVTVWPTTYKSSNQFDFVIGARLRKSSRRSMYKI